MPTSVVALVIFLLLALPGYTYQRRMQRHAPELTRSAFDEVLVILFSGAAIDAAVAVLFVVGGAWFQPPFPRLEQFITSPRTYLAQNLGQVSLWSSAFLVLAVGLAFLIASPRWGKLGLKVLRGTTEQRSRNNPNQSAWWLLFHENPGTRVYVGCMLTDGAYIAGYLHSYSTLAAETPDRELTLRGDVRYRSAGATESSVLPNVNAVSVKAERIQILTVSYVDPPAVEERDVDSHGTDDDS